MPLLGVLVTALVLSVHVIRGAAADGDCPHETAGLRRWSDEDGWTALGLTKPTAGDAVVITDDVLLDVSPPELASVEIEEGGSLVFSPDGDYTLVTGYVMIYGALYIGSEQCKFLADARITLTGKRGDHNVDGFGDKFIGVAEGATLELHGQNKLAWTKLSTTLPKLTMDNGLVYDNKEDRSMDRGSLGLTVYVLDGATGETKFARTIYLVGTHTYRLTYDPPKFFAAINNVSDGDVVVMAVQKDAIGDMDTDMEPFYDAIENATLGEVTDSLEVRKLKAKNAWVLVAVKGEFVKEKLETRILDDNKCKASLTVPVPKLDVVLNIESTTVPDGNVYRGWVRAVVAPMNVGARIVDLASEASTWRPGDRVVVTSTDFDHRQAEVAEVGYCSPTDCNSNQIRLLLLPSYMHYGEVTDGVDMRGEVALLSRNIVIEGRMEDKCPGVNRNCNKYKFDTYGGHIQIEKDFASVRIEGVELRHMGQLPELNRHPIYFHMCGNSSVPAYVKSVSIADSYSMCIAVKGTHSLLLQDNAAYNHFGHCYALLEGGEKGNILDGNLGAGTKEFDRNGLSKQSTTFFITNPLTYVRNNVAAGGNKKGFWYVFPQQPLGESLGLNLMAKYEARATPLSEFYNNAAHSYGDTGLYIENELQSTSAGGSNQYKPRENPLDEDSDQKEVVLHRFTGFKNRQRNALIRGGFITMDKASLADSARGVYFIPSNGEFKTLRNSIVVGESANIGEPYRMWVKATKEYYNFPRSIPFTWDYRYPVQGVMVQDGPLRVRDAWFNHFLPNENRSAAAIGFYPKVVWPSSPNNDVKDLQFGFDDGESTGLRVYESDDSEYPFGSKAGDLDSILYDADGSLTGVPDTTLVKPEPVYTTARCYTQDSWGMAICPHSYAKLKIQGKGAHRRRSNPILTRDDLNPSDGGLLIPNDQYTQFPVITGGSHSYILHWDTFFPSPTFITGRGITKDHGVRVGICVPRNAVLKLYTYSPVRKSRIGLWTQVFSVDEIDEDTVGGKYFHDVENGILFVKFINYETRGEGSPSECGDGTHCPMVKIELESGDGKDCDCRERMSAYARDPISPQPALISAFLPASSLTAPAGLGAGEFFPLTTRSVVDGGYGDWSEWGPCTTTCGGGTQIRSRACDSPIPQNGGKPCSGPSEETQICSTNPCEIHGNFSTWSTWSPCQAISDNGNIHGYQIRSRACDDPAPQYNGEVCVGDTKEVNACLLATSA